MKVAIFSILLAILLGWILVPLVRRLGNRFGITDLPNHRKAHQGVIPCSGGVAIYLTFFICVFVTISIFPDLYQKIGLKIARLAFVSTLLLSLGLYDDRRDMPGRWKLLGQVIIGLLAIGLGFRIDILTNPFGGTFYLGWLGIPITLFWFLGLINIMNLIDGLDGLATGITAIASLVLFFVSLLFGDVVFSMLVACLAGATLSFLRFNLSPKKIFLGDNGSMLLGFLLASIAIIGAHKGAVFSTLLITIFCLGVPIYDTASVIVRRLKNGVDLFCPDKEHVHHRLLSRGFSQREVVLILFGITLALGLTGLLIVSLKDIGRGIILIIAGAAVLLIKRDGGLLNSGRLKKKGKLPPYQ